MSVSEVICSCVSLLKREGWCMVEGVLPYDRIEALREHVIQGHNRALNEYADRGGSLGWQAGPNDEPGTNAVAYVPELARYFADDRVVDIVKALLDPHIRIAQTEFKTRPAGEMKSYPRGYHSDWPHDLTDREQAGAVMMPFPNVTMGITALWMLSEFSPENGATWVVPKSHLDARNPRSHLDPRNPPELHDDVDPAAPIPGEIQLSGPAGNVVLLDSRIWHSAGANPSEEPRVTVLTRYSPWWISVEFGHRNLAVVPPKIYETFPDGVKDLYRHRV